MYVAVARFPSPLGLLTVTASDTALTGVHFPHSPRVPPLHVVERGPGGEDHVVESGPGGEDRSSAVLERRVWDALRAIPYGTTVSYGDLARRLGDMRTTRAVGAANGKNPIAIIVPCHRVVGSRGELTGYGGGLDRKRWLLEHEGALLALGR